MNQLYICDCLDILKKWDEEGKKEFIDVIYIDPPFNSKRDYNILYTSMSSETAFTDTWSKIDNLEELENIGKIDSKVFNFLNSFLKCCNVPSSYISYLIMISYRLLYMKKMLKPSGSFYFHCDDVMVSHVKLLLDIIFGISNFRNIINWRRTYTPASGFKSRSHKFSRDTDYILFYTKSKKYYFNAPSNPMPQEKIDKGFYLDDNDGRGAYYWATFADIPNDKKLKEGFENNTMRWNKPHKPQYKRYKSKADLNIKIGNWWDDIIPITGNSKKSLCYPTQKPVELIKRIFLSSTESGQLVADFFCGGGTSAIAAEELGLNWILCDINYRAIQLTKERLENKNRVLGKHFEIGGIPKSSEDLKNLIDDNVITRTDVERIVYKYYINAVSVVGNKNHGPDGGVDGRFVFKYKGKLYNGIVQVTTGSNINHFKAFCHEIEKNTGDIGIYIAFKDKITSGMKKESLTLKKRFGVRRLQILTFENLIDKGVQPQIPRDILTI